MRPLPGGNWCKPGAGLENIVGDSDGKAIQTRRNLKKEQKALKSVLAACPLLAASDNDGQEWLLAEPQAALEVLSELQALDSALLECVWPEGERLRIKSRRGLAQLSLGIKQQGDWFVLNGALKLDDGRVLQLRDLLELMRETPGRFLKLGDDDWLALTEAMKKRLEELALLADHVGRDGLRVSALAAAQLAELAGEVGDFDADDAWQAQAERLQSLQAFQPQLPSTLQAELRDYQRDGYDWMARLAHWGVGACLAMTAFGSDQPTAVYIAGFFVGAVLYPVYSLNVAHANDLAEPHEYVTLSSAIMILYGMGTVTGPIMAGTLMQGLGPSALIAFLACAFALYAGYAAWRITRRPDTVTPEEKADFQATIVPMQGADNASPIADTDR